MESGQAPPHCRRLTVYVGWKIDFANRDPSELGQLVGPNVVTRP